MKRIAILVLVIFVLPSIAFADQDKFHVEGEWYASVLYSEYHWPAEIDEDGNFHVSQNDEFSVFNRNGYIETPEETIELKFADLSNGMALFYAIVDNELRGYVFMEISGEWVYCSIDASKMLLLIDGNMIPYNGGDVMSYLVSGNNMYMTNGESYVRGVIRCLGDNSFAYDMDIEPDVGGFPERWGKPFYLFINTAVIK